MPRGIRPPRTLSPEVEQLVARRRSLTISQGQLATLACVPFRALSRWESGLGRAMYPEEMARMERVLAVLEQLRREALSTAAAAS